MAMDFNKMRRWFPWFLAEYIDWVVNDKFSAMENRLNTISNNIDSLSRNMSNLQTAATNAATTAAQNAVNEIKRMSGDELFNLVKLKTKEQAKDEAIAQLKLGVFNAKNNTQRLKTYIDTKAEIDKITSKDANTIYYGTE